MKLYKGKSKYILDNSVETSLLAVESYNSPRSGFRVENYVILIIIAWTKLFHAYFYKTKGDVFYYKNKNNTRYKRIDGEKQAWELKTCIKEFKKTNDTELLTEAIEANLNFFIKLRNKLEHRYVKKKEIESLVFGEFQALLYNYETFIVALFGEEFALQENLAFSLQFSTIRNATQKIASKRALSTELNDLKKFIEKYRLSLSDNIYNSQEYSIRLLLIPKVSNTKSNDIAIEFITPSSKTKYKELLGVLTKDKTKKVETANLERYLPGKVVKLVNKNKLKYEFKLHLNTWLCKIFGIRPYKKDGVQAPDPFETNTKYCLYDEAHNNYVYTKNWVNFIPKIIKKLDVNQLKKLANKGRSLAISEYDEA